MNLPNRLSLLRIVLIPFFLVTVAYLETDWHSMRWLAVGIFSLAVITDGVDGFLARIRNDRTRLGSYLDPLADKLLLSSAFVALSMQGYLDIRPPIWVPIVIISRDAILIMGCVVVAMIKGKIEITPSILGKFTTVTQMASILFILFQSAVAPVVWLVAVILTAISGFEYILKAMKWLDQSEPHQTP
jgi:CDP-diacylglycerol--glycerol-3-phosphate 3-phosphatidyltransferase